MLENYGNLRFEESPKASLTRIVDLYPMDCRIVKSKMGGWDRFCMLFCLEKTGVLFKGLVPQNADDPPIFGHFKWDNMIQH